MKALTIDFDNYRERFEDLMLLKDLIPFKARLSANRKGLHILKICHDEDEYLHAISIKQKLDDPKRLLIDGKRTEIELTGNVLFNQKCIGHDKKVAGKWVDIESESDLKNIEERLK